MFTVNAADNCEPNAVHGLRLSAIALGEGGVIMHGCSVVLFTMYMLTDVWLKTHCIKQSVRLCTWSNGLLFVVFILHWLISRTIRTS